MFFIYYLISNTWLFSLYLRRPFSSQPPLRSVVLPTIRITLPCIVYRRFTVCNCCRRIVSLSYSFSFTLHLCHLSSSVFVHASTRCLPILSSPGRYLDCRGGRVAGHTRGGLLPWRLLHRDALLTTVAPSTPTPV